MSSSTFSAELSAYFLSNQQGFFGKKNFKVAVTGHRMNLLTPEACTRLAAPIDDVLNALASCINQVFRLSNDNVKPAAPVVLSALAEGADRLITKRALELGWQLNAILPFNHDEYQNDFDSTDSKKEFFELLSMAKSFRALNNTRKQLEPTAYEAVGEALVLNCDLLIAVWDGEPARGPGGTADVVKLARTKGIPIIWIKSDETYEIELMQ